MSSSTTREEGIAATDHEAWNGSTKTNDTPRRNLSALEESYMYMKGLRNTWWYDFQQVDAKELVTKLIRYVFTFNGGARTEEEWEALRRLVLIRQCEYCTQRSFPIRLHTYYEHNTASRASYINPLHAHPRTHCILNFLSTPYVCTHPRTHFSSLRVNRSMWRRRHPKKNSVFVKLETILSVVYVYDRIAGLEHISLCK